MSFYFYFLDLCSSENETDNAGGAELMTRRLNIETTNFGMRASEDIKQYKRFATQCIFILYMLYFSTFSTVFQRNILLFFSCFHMHHLCYKNQVHTDRGYCVIPKITARSVNRQMPFNCFMTYILVNLFKRLKYGIFCVERKRYWN